MAEPYSYLIALGSNMRHPRYGPPREVIHAALTALNRSDLRVLRASQTSDTAPIGPSLRRYANAAAIIESALSPLALLERLQQVERNFGRLRRGGLSWRARQLDLDIILWSGGIWASDTLIIPHPLFRQRSFVLRGAAQIAPRWRDPITGLCIAHLYTRLTKPRAAPR